MRWLGRALLALLVGFGLLQAWFLAHVLWWRAVPPSETAFMRQGMAQLRQEDPSATLKHTWVPAEALSRHLKRAVIAAEDSLFVQHQGFDWENLHKAWRQNQRRGKVVRGGSTITQQLAKNLFLSGQRSLWRKSQEALITLMIEATWSKQRILTVYLNSIEWGHGVYGAEAASQHYFGRSADALSRDQAARLAAMIPRPRYFDEHRWGRGLNRKTGIILRRMPQVSVPD